MSLDIKNNSLLTNVVILIVALMIASIVLALVLEIVKLLIPIAIFGALVLGLVYLFNKVRS